jgi:putative flippase GtrA
MTNPSAQQVAEVKRVGKFGLVGIINTLIDFVIYNVLFGILGLDVRIANIISTTCAMIFSFTANKQLVFGRGSGSLVKQAVVFYAVTAFGLYVLQTGTIHILTDIWTTPLHVAVSIIHGLGFGEVFSDTFIINNGAKAVGTVLSLTWNYMMYKKVVFR